MPFCCFLAKGPSAHACAADRLTQHVTATRNTQHHFGQPPSNPSNPSSPTDTDDAWENNSWQSEQSLASKNDYYTHCMRKEKRSERHVHMERKWTRTPGRDQQEKRNTIHQSGRLELRRCSDVTIRNHQVSHSVYRKDLQKCSPSDHALPYGIICIDASMQSMQCRKKNATPV